MHSHRKWTRLALLLGVLLLAQGLPAIGPDVARALDVGAKAPDFTLPSTTGTPISLGQFRGKKLVLLEFYGADFSPL